jgi:glycosyltransferase involved in cell wall biosynthesis
MDLLKEHGHDVIPFSMKHPNNHPSDFSQYFVETIDYTNKSFFRKVSSATKVVYSLEARRRLSSLLEHSTPDIAHFHNFHHQLSPSIITPLVKKGVPIVMTVHDLKLMCPNYKMLSDGKVCELCKGGKFFNCVLRKCTKGSRSKSLVNAVEMYLHRFLDSYRHVDRFIAVSNFFKRKMVEYGFPEDKIVHIPNYVDATKFKVSVVDKGYVLYFGRLSEEKGVSTLLNAMGILPSIPLIVAGTGPIAESLQAEAHHLGNVSFVGYKSGEELSRLIQECSFTVLPSEVYENCPMSVLESLAYGKPVIGSHMGGIPELINDSIDGYVFKAGNAADLADKMSLMWHHSDKRREMGGNGRNRIENQYSASSYFDKISSLYDEVLCIKV